MNANFIRRLGQLEAEKTTTEKPIKFRFCAFRGLPPDFVGESHQAIVPGADDGGQETYVIEERPGPAPEGLSLDEDASYQYFNLLLVPSPPEDYGECGKEDQARWRKSVGLSCDK